MHQIGIPVVVLALQALVLFAELRHGQWKKVSIQEAETEKFGPLYVTRSQIACGLQCSNYPGCYLYCYNKVNSTCQVKTNTSSGSSLPEHEAVQCYKHRCAFTAGYFPYSGRCIQLFKKELSYPEARQRCEQDGAHLYHYKTKDEMPPISDVMRDNGYGLMAVKPLAWIGVDDMIKEGSFVWSDGDLLSSDSDLWFDNNPDGDGNENCVEIKTNYSLNYSLNDRSCTSALFFICQLDLY